MIELHFLRTLIDILAKKVLFSLTPDKIFNPIKSLVNGAEGLTIIRANLINNLLVIVLKNRGETFLQIRNRQNL